LVVHGQDKMKWSFALQACCSLNHDTISLSLVAMSLEC
jgi:hypothetical protein